MRIVSFFIFLFVITAETDKRRLWGTLHKEDAPRRLLQLNLTFFRNGVALLVTPFLFSYAPQ